MIEWVPIKDWNNTDPIDFLVYTCFEKSYQIAKARYGHNGYIYTSRFGIFDKDGNGISHDSVIMAKLTHCAKINIPVEQTLEQKFYEHYCRNSNKSGLFTDFAQIAKEHYDGKE